MQVYDTDSKWWSFGDKLYSDYVVSHYLSLSIFPNHFFLEYFENFVLSYTNSYTIFLTLAFLSLLSFPSPFVQP